MNDKEKAIHKQAIERFNEILEREKSQRELAIEDANFVHTEDGQWEDDAITKRKDRPRYTLDRVSGAIDQVTGDQRQTRTHIKVVPSDGGDKGIAKINSGIIRAIENNSDADSIYDAAFDETATGGYGGWRVLTDYNSDDSFEQDIVLAPIKSAASSLYFDPNAQKYDKRDAMYAFYIKDMAEEAFKAAYPDASMDDFTSLLKTNANSSAWFRDDIVKVAEYWVVEMKDADIALMSDGRVINLTEEAKVIDELALEGITIVKQRRTQVRSVKSYIMNGAEILRGAQDWAGKYIPLVPVYGKTYNIEGKEYIRGLVRKAKDAQRIYNYAQSTMIETTALTPKDPIWITAEQAKGYESKLKTFNTSNSPFMLYNADPKAGGMPQRGGAPQVQSSLIQQVNQAAQDIYMSTGIQPASMGVNPELQSGKAIIAQQKMGDRGSFIFTDNLHKSIKFTGDILVDLLPRIYDTERVVKIMHFDGESEDIKINARDIANYNQTLTDGDTGEEVIVNDLSVGKYEAIVQAGASYSSKRQESAQQLIDLATGSPRFEALTADLIAKDLDVLESDELHKRLRMAMIKDGTIQPTEDEIKELGLGNQQPSDEQKALLENIQLQNAQMMAKIENINADTDKKDAQTLDTKTTAQGNVVKAYNDLIDAYRMQNELGIDLGISEAHMMKAQQGLVDLSQEELVKDNV